MKSSERHHLKENELTHALGDLSERLAGNRSSVGLIAGIVIAVLVAAGGYWAWQTRTNNRAALLLSDAFTIVQSPISEAKPGATPAAGTYPTVTARAEAALAKFNEAADSYPSTSAGIAARYYSATTLALLNRSADAATRYQEVVDRTSGDNFYRRMAQLGVIEARAQGKQYDQAITGAQALVNNTADESVPRDALLMVLGRAQVAAGKKAEAKQTLDKMIADFPESPFVDEAKRLLTGLT